MARRTAPRPDAPPTAVSRAPGRRNAGHLHVTHSDVPAEVVVRPLFVPATKRSVPGGFSMLFNRLFEHGYWARLGDVERAVYPALGYFARFSDGFEAEASMTELADMTGLGRTSIKKAITQLTGRGLVSIERPGSGRTKALYRLLVPLKGAEESYQADAAEARRQAKAREQSAPASESPSRPPEGRHRDPLPDAVAAPRVSPSRPPAGRCGEAQEPFIPLRRETPSKTQPHLDESPADAVVVVLGQLGVTDEVAAQLADEFEADYLHAYINAFRRNRAEGRRYSPGWLVNAIREGWDVRHLKRSTTPATPSAANHRPVLREVEDPFEAAWRAVDALDDAEFEDHRAAAVAEADEPAIRRKLIESDRDSTYLRSVIAERLMRLEASVGSA